MGNGTCNFTAYQQLERSTTSLVSFSWASIYSVGVITVGTGVWTGLFHMLSYFQGYAAYYYLNSTTLMQI